MLCDRKSTQKRDNAKILEWSKTYFEILMSTEFQFKIDLFKWDDFIFYMIFITLSRFSHFRYVSLMWDGKLQPSAICSNALPTKLASLIPEWSTNVCTRSSIETLNLCPVVNNWEISVFLHSWHFFFFIDLTHFFFKVKCEMWCGISGYMWHSFLTLAFLVWGVKSVSCGFWIIFIYLSIYFSIYRWKDR